MKYCWRYIWKLSKACLANISISILFSSLSLAQTFGGSKFGAEDMQGKSSQPLAGNIKMPPVTPLEAARYLGERVVPKADPVPFARSDERKPAKLDVRSSLGHELPTDSSTPFGFKRVDFAIGAPVGSSLRSKIGEPTAGQVIDARKVRSEVKEQAPTVGLR